MKTNRVAVRKGQPATGKKPARKPTQRVPHDRDPRDPRRRAEGQGRKDTRRRPEVQPRTRARDPRALQHGPATTPARRPVRPKNTSQAKARAKARKAKAPKVVRIPLRERLLTRLASIDLNPRTLAARVPFVVLVIAALGVGLGVTLWLSTDAAERSYQLGSARATNQGLLQQKEALERDVLEAQAAPALAEAARNLGMIPSKDTAHLVQDPAGNWIVVGDPKPAQGVPPPPLNTPLPDETPAPTSRPAPAASPVERPVRIPSTPVIPGLAAPAVPLAAVPGAPPEILVRQPAAVPAPAAVPEHAPAAAPGDPALGPVPGPEPAPALGPVPAPAPVHVPGVGTPPGPVESPAPPVAPITVPGPA